MTKGEAITLAMEQPGWCTLQKAMRLYDLVYEGLKEFIGREDPGIYTVVELGVFGGKSFIPMAAACKGHPKSLCVAIDCWDNVAPLEGSNAPANNDYWAKLPMEEIYEGFKEALKKMRFQAGYNPIVMRGRTDNVYDFFSDGQISVIHQDGNHNVETITRELELWVPKLKKGGLWITDDNDWTEAQPGYAKLPEFGLVQVEDYVKWQVWRKTV